MELILGRNSVARIGKLISENDCMATKIKIGQILFFHLRKNILSGFGYKVLHGLQKEPMN